VAVHEPRLSLRRPRQRRRFLDRLATPGSARHRRTVSACCGDRANAPARPEDQCTADTASRTSANSIASGAGAVTAVATRIASELKTLDTYLTTTPSGQLDPGYISSQTAYLAQQLTRLEGDAGSLSNPVASFQAALHKLTRDAKALKIG
jgi:hypothetical protein